MTRPTIVAHRGFSARAPENTLAAIEAAIEAGARQIEWDLHTAACGTPVVFHDFDLERTTDGTGPIADRTYEELRELDAGAWFSDSFQGEVIPTFEQALETVAGRADHVYAEIKGTRSNSDLAGIAEVARRSGMADRLTFISLDWPLLEGVRTFDPRVPLGYIVTAPKVLQEAIDCAELDGNAVLSLRHRIVLDAPGTVDRISGHGLACVVWTVNDTGEADELLDAGIRVFTTDEVERLLVWAAAVGDGGG